MGDQADFDEEGTGETGSEQDRRQPRDSMFLQAPAALLDQGEALMLRVRNLSAGGMMADCERVCERGDPVVVEIRGVGPVTGRIAWRQGGKIGITFDEAIDPRLARKPVSGGAKVQSMTTADLERMRRPGFRSFTR
ncbi:hypothetical protein ACFB49_01010 [Sphingomonas sp. DBB INV C78]|uniref:PilZ domain-containing protein n=1 Tax=Sphingomonas sp. DBB INV C78 TaxID=3349434 RepID=UPI0036D23C4A